VVLGAWHSEGSMVKVTPDDVELIHFPFCSCASTIPKSPFARVKVRASVPAC
jgi:hypothetical protein